MRRNRDHMVDEPPKVVSLPSSSDYLINIEELRFKDYHFFAQNTLPPIFVNYQPLPIIDELWGKNGPQKESNQSWVRAD